MRWVAAAQRSRPSVRPPLQGRRQGQRRGHSQVIQGWPRPLWHHWESEVTEVTARVTLAGWEAPKLPNKPQTLSDSVRLPAFYIIMSRTEVQLLLICSYSAAILCSCSRCIGGNNLIMRKLTAGLIYSVYVYLLKLKTNKYRKSESLINYLCVNIKVWSLPGVVFPYFIYFCVYMCKQCTYIHISSGNKQRKWSVKE